MESYPRRSSCEDRRYLLIGVGLNVTTNLDEAPALVKAMATSLAAVSASPIEGDLPARLHGGDFPAF